MPQNRSSIFNGSTACGNGTAPPRQVIMNVPAAYRDGDRPLPVLVMQDGGFGGASWLLDLVVHAQSNLPRSLPPFAVVAVANGGIERSAEYDTMSDAYARFVEHEVFPTLLASAELRGAYPRLSLTADPDGRATLGCSSGGIAALTMAYFRPDLFRRVAAYSPSAVDLQCPTAPARRAYPRGAWGYHSGQRLLVARPEPQLRVFVADNELDLGWNGTCPSWVTTKAEQFALGCWAEWDCDPPGSCCDGNHSFVDAGNRTAAALRAGRYQYRHVYALGQHHCAMSDNTDRNVWTHTLADTLVWLWQGYRYAQQ